MIRSLLTAAAIALAAPAAASPYCDTPQTTARMLARHGYAPAWDLWREEPANAQITLWISTRTERWALTEGDSDRTCVVDSGRGHAMDPEHVFMGAPA